MALHKKGGTPGKQRSEQGYVLLTLMLFVALLTIAAAVAAPGIAFRIKRDREDELVHRGVQYSRAIRAFSKKTGRYPARLEELRDTNGLKFIRKFYKDPITGRDFKLLHMADVTPQGGIAKLNPSDPQTAENAGTATNETANADGAGASGAKADATASTPEGSAPQARTGDAAGARNSPASTGFQFSASPDVQPGLLIFGVASTSKAKTIREFSHKNHYNDWLFFYDPRYDRGYEIKGPTVASPSTALQTPPSSQSPSAPQPQP
jgi:type II secretory pathway pseudopilin PulG